MGVPSVGDVPDAARSTKFRADKDEKSNRGQEGGAHKETTPDEVQVLREAVRRAYRNFRFDLAIEKANAVFAHYASTSRGKAEVLVYAGAAWYLKGDSPKAIRCFRIVHELFPGMRPDKSEFSVQVLKLFSQAAP